MEPVGLTYPTDEGGMMRYRYSEDNPNNLKGQMVEWGGGGYEQKGNVDITQEQSIHVHVHIHINNVEGGEALPETVESVSLLGRVLNRLLRGSKGQGQPDNVERLLPRETFNAMMDNMIKELDHIEE